MVGPKSNKRKLAAQNNGRSNKVAKAVTNSLPSPPSSTETNEPKNFNTVISEEELEVTVDTLLTLAEHPNIIKSKPCKNLRAAVFDFRQACTTGVNTAGEYYHHILLQSRSDHRKQAMQISQLEYLLQSQMESTRMLWLYWQRCA